MECGPRHSRAGDLVSSGPVSRGDGTFKGWAVEESRSLVGGGAVPRKGLVLTPGVI